MILHPNKFIQFAAILLPLTAIIAIPVVGTWFAAGILLSGIFLAFNLYFWIRIVAHVISRVAQGASASGLQFFLFMKLLVLATCITIGALFFPLMSIIIGNSIIVLSVLLPSFYASYKGSYTSLSVAASQ